TTAALRQHRHRHLQRQRRAHRKTSLRCRRPALFRKNPPRHAPTHPANSPTARPKSLTVGQPPLLHRMWAACAESWLSAPSKTPPSSAPSPCSPTRIVPPPPHRPKSAPPHTPPQPVHA